MTRCLTGLVTVILLSSSAVAADELENWPDGPGAEETYYLCNACHSLNLVRQHGLSRKRWDETLTWMVEKQGMPKLEDEERERVLDFLARHFGPGDNGAGGGMTSAPGSGSLELPPLPGK